MFRVSICLRRARCVKVPATLRQTPPEAMPLRFAGGLAAARRADLPVWLYPADTSSAAALARAAKPGLPLPADGRGAADDKPLPAALGR